MAREYFKMTVLETLKAIGIPMPKKVWDCRVFGPMGMDDLMVVSAQYQIEEGGEWREVVIKPLELGADFRSLPLPRRFKREYKK